MVGTVLYFFSNSTLMWERVTYWVKPHAVFAVYNSHGFLGASAAGLVQTAAYPWSSWPCVLPCVCRDRFHSLGAKLSILECFVFFFVLCLASEAFLQFLIFQLGSFQFPEIYFFFSSSPHCYFLGVWISGPKEAIFWCWFLLCHFWSPPANSIFNCESTTDEYSILIIQSLFEKSHFRMHEISSTICNILFSRWCLTM